MSVPVFKNIESVYIVILRSPDAKNLLHKWLSSNRYASARVDDNRLYINDHNTYNLFLVTWSNGWDNILVWDCYMKRHIYI